MFNRLEEIADSAAPTTPFLGGRLSRALEPQEGTEDRFLPTRINWVVQNGAAYRAALTMHVTNLLTRSFCVARIGLNDLPQSVAFFSTVEVDTVLLKEIPSNPHGLAVGYGIPNGESLDIYQLLKKLGPRESDMQTWDWHRPAVVHATKRPKKNVKLIKSAK